MTFNGREWANMELLNSYKTNSGLILDYKLAIENYEDFTGKRVEDFHAIDKLWNDKKSNTNLNDDEMYNESVAILNKFKALVNSIGCENFTTYKDGSIEYKVKK